MDGWILLQTIFVTFFYHYYWLIIIVLQTAIQIFKKLISSYNWSLIMIINNNKFYFSDNALHRHRPRRYLPPYPTPPLPAGVTRPTLGLMMFHVNFQYSRVPCADSPSRRTSLTEDQLMQLFVRKGGKFRPSLMAIDEERALSDFPNLLPIGQAKVRNVLR